MKKIFLILFVSIFICNLNIFGQNEKRPKALLIGQIKEDADYVLERSKVDEILAKESIRDYDYQMTSGVQERSVSCLKAIKELLDSNIPETETIDLESGKITLRELTDQILNINQKATHIGMIDKLEQSAGNALTWSKSLGNKEKLSEAQLEVAANAGKTLQKLVVAAQKMGFPDMHKITAAGSESSFTIPELKEIGNYVATAGGRLKKEIEAARLAKDEPYLKILSGDKLRIFKQEFAGLGGQFEVSTSGNRSLPGPEALKSASVWYTWGNNTSGLVDVWHITGWRFQGDKLTGNSSYNGIGLKPPTAAFK